ncbi:hypothetical protein LJR267_010638 [Paraburkholderia hospita]|uniref:hypothetical protein n=1 Tax=Paraburkholderia hospita TaxID=169430 RepID=UPI003ED11865
MMGTNVSAFVKFVAGSIFGGVIATVGSSYTATVTDKALNRPRRIDVQQVPELSWGAESPVPNVQFSYHNIQTNAKIDQIVGKDVELFNYTDRDAPETQIAIIARNTDGSAPVFVGARARDGAIEDVLVERQLTPVVHGDSLAFSFKVPTVLRTDGSTGNRSLQLYFAGKVPPVLSVTAGATGFGWQPWDSSHFREMQLAMLSPWQRFGPQLGGAALLLGVLVVLAIVIAPMPTARAREKSRMLRLIDVIDKSLLSADLPDVSDDARRKLAADIAFDCWTSIYESMKGLEKAVSATPERIA